MQASNILHDDWDRWQWAGCGDDHDSDSNSVYGNNLNCGSSGSSGGSSNYIIEKKQLYNLILFLPSK